MFILDKLFDLAEYLGNQIRCIQSTLDTQPLSPEEFKKLSSELETCEKLHMQVLDKSLPF